MTLGA